MNLLSDPRKQQAARRAATAMSVLDAGAWIGLFVGCLFWNNFFWLMVAPTVPLEMLLSVAMSAGYAVILPMLVSLLAPSTPAGMALAQTRYKTIGNVVAIAAALFMCFHAFMILSSWWAARPTVAAAGQDLLLAVGTMIVFIVVPALAWVQVAPDRWVAEIVQAQQVRRLQAAQQANIMAAQVQYARAMTLLRRGLANATAEERAELAGTLIAMQRAENEAIAQVADQLRLVTGIDTGVRLLDDPAIEQHYFDLTTRMERLIAPINEPAISEPPPLPMAQSAPVTTRPNASERVAAPAVAVTHGDAPRATAAPNDPRYEEFYTTARERLLGQTWTIRQLGDSLTVSESQAREFVATWQGLGWVDKTQLRGHYSWKES